MNKQDSTYLPNPKSNTISNLESEILERGDHEILENLEKNEDKPVITKRSRTKVLVTSPHNQEKINPVEVHKKNNITPIYQPNFRLSPRQVDWLTLEVQRLEREGKIMKTKSPFNSPLNLVAKDNYALADLKLGPEITISVKFYLIEGDSIFGPGTDDCILGQDFLQEYATEWDFNNRTICLAHEGLNYLVHVDDDETRIEASRVEILNRADILTTLNLPGVEPNTKIKVPLRLYGSGKYDLAMNHLQQITTNAATQEPLAVNDWNTLIPLLRSSVLINGG
jgi:hypothetical protein